MNKPTWIMDKKTVFIKTAKGEQDGSNLSSDLRRILSLIDNKSRADELAKRAPPSLRAGWMDFLGELVEGGYIRDKDASSAGPKIAVPKSSLLKMFSSKPDAEPEMEELDYNSGYVAPAPNAAALAAKQKSDAAERVRKEMEAAVAAAKIRASAEAIAKAEAKARQDAEQAAHAKALAQTEAAIKAEYKAKKEAESAARAKATAEAKTNQEAGFRSQEQLDAARARAKLEEAVRVRAEIEAAARAQQVAEAKAKQELAARMKAEQEAAQAKAALEAAAKAKIEEAARVRAEIEAATRAKQLAEELAKREVEAARIKAEQEIARARAELEAAAKVKAKLEEEARARAEIEAAARARQLAEELARREAEAARLKAEQEALKIKVELETAKARAEAEAKALADALATQIAGERSRQESESARLKAEQAAVLLRAEQEAAIRIRAEAEIKAAAEALARQQFAERAPSPAAPTTNSFEINLDSFTDGAGPATQNVAPAGQYIKQASARVTDEQKQGAPAERRAEPEINSMYSVAAEMARLKSEAEAARRKLEEEERRQAEEKALAEEQSRAWEEAEQRAKVQAILEVEQAAQQAVLSQAKATQTPVVRKHRKPLPLGKIAFGLIVLALMAVVVLPYVYPLNEYIAPLEQQLTARLKQPVRIGGMSASSLPPKLNLRSVTVGNAQEVKIGNIELNFDLVSLFSEVKIISNAEIEDVSIQGNQLDKQAAKLKMLGSDARYPVRHLTLQRVKIVTDDIAVPVLSGIADMDIQGAFSRIALHSSDDKLGIDLQPGSGGWQISLSLKESSLLILPDVVFSDLSAKGILTDSEVNFSEMDAHIFNGILLGKAKLSWSKGWQLQGNLEAKTFDLDKMFPAYRVVGEMYGEGNFSMAGANISQMDDTPHLEGSFSVKKGTINLDIVETARLLSRENLVGGRTNYDDLIGLFLLDNHVLHFHQLRIASGALSASGAFDVSAGNQISGNLNAEIKMRSGNNPLTLYGTIVEPKLRAGR